MIDDVSSGLEGHAKALSIVFIVFCLLWFSALTRVVGWDVCVIFYICFATFCSSFSDVVL